MNNEKKTFINLKNPKHLRNLRLCVMITSALIIIGGFIALLYRIDSGFVIVVVGAIYYFIGMVIINKLVTSLQTNHKIDEEDSKE